MELRDPRDPEGLPAKTRYAVRGRRGGRTLVELVPETGRQHQIRLHLAWRGHPIVGDKLYGPGGVEPFMEYIETGMTDRLRRRLGMARQALHAHSVEVPHPSTLAPLRVVSALPTDMAQLWDELAHGSMFAGPGTGPLRFLGAPSDLG
jgi:23S rRNA pseudouridine1911/1915/1917 synthase